MTRANAEPNGKKPTVAQAKAVWEAEIEPTLDKVFVRLHAAGFTGMAFSTLQRWRARGWPERVKVMPEITAKAETVTAEVTGTGKKRGPPLSEPTDEEQADPDDSEMKVLAALEPADLAALATKESLIAQVMLARRIQQRAMKLVQYAPKDAANLIEALKGPTSNVTVVLPGKSAENPQPVGGKMIEHDASERPLTALQSSIREFRQTMKVVK